MSEQVSKDTEGFVTNRFGQVVCDVCGYCNEHDNHERGGHKFEPRRSTVATYADLQKRIERLEHRAKNVLWYFANHPDIVPLMEIDQPMRKDVHELSAAVRND